ncbi:hypothetical protein Leryth_006576 [Lithospermum erythrorhizon]|nr:hypothetical protein Leryth_006576 [Lithospermum erythrorhizon]
MVRVKRLTSSRTSQRANKDSNPSISLTGVNSEAEKHDEGNTHASCHNINHDLEERCSEHCSSLRTSDDYPVVGVDISEDMVTDQLSKPCDGETNIISSNLNSTTFNNFLTDMKVNSRKRIECRRKGFLQSVKPLKTYCRRKGGYASLQSVKLLKTYCRRRSGYESLGITPLLVQNSLGTKLEDIDVVHPVKKTMLCVDINTCQKETTARDGESLDIAGDMVLEKVRNGQSHVNPLAAESKNFRSPVPPGSTQEQSVELDPSEKSDIIVDETCDVLFTENNLNKSTNEMKNGASLVERKQDNVEEASLVSSETMKQHIIAQSGTAGTKKFPQEAPSVSIKRKLLVLDINGLLADIVSADDVSQESGVNPDLIIGRKAVFKRPFCDEFLEFCFERFSVGVWSSRVKYSFSHSLFVMCLK